uniref:CCHC-type domain-containing protein n=1 Tax=Sinocyclocheilus rhinocerous TaxID=307959 RepID=A0A673MIZ5_9TELE
APLTGLEGWCRGEILNEAHALMVIVPKEIDISQIEETLQSVKCLGKVLDSLTVLCECKEVVDPSKVPPDILPTGGKVAWPIVMVTRSLVSPGAPSSAKQTDLSTAGNDSNVQELLNIGLSKLKRCRIMESLRGPALAIVKAAHLTTADLKPEQCLEAIEIAFVSAESGEELYIAFWLMQKQPSEKMSDFLKRLEQSLTKVIQRGGLSIDSAKRTRVEQLFRGAVSSDLMLVNLKLRETKENPPSFLELLSEIRSGEEYEASRAKLISTVKKPIAPVASLTVETSRHFPGTYKQTTSSEADEYYCYRCGESGHFAAKCRNPENQSKVIHWLIQSKKN